MKIYILNQSSLPTIKLVILSLKQIRFSWSILYFTKKICHQYNVNFENNAKILRLHKLTVELKIQSLAKMVTVYFLNFVFEKYKSSLVSRSSKWFNKTIISGGDYFFDFSKKKNWNVMIINVYRINSYIWNIIKEYLRYLISFFLYKNLIIKFFRNLMDL